MDNRERYGDIDEAVAVAVGAGLLGAWTALPGIVQSFDPVAVTAVVQPAIEGTTRTIDLVLSQVSLPLLTDVPVLFAGGGGVTLTFPVSEGDEALLVFSSRCIDQWWAQGGVQRAGSNRSHNLSDAIAIVGLRSKARPLANISTTSAQLRTDDGQTLIDLNPTTHVMTFDAMSFVFNGPMQVNGTVTATGDVVGGSISLEQHDHGNVSNGDGVTGPPQG